MMEATLEVLLPQKTKFDLIVHDWGCVLGLMFQNKHPDLVDKIVAIDVGIMDGPIKLSDVLRIMFYQTWFATSFAISQIFGTTIGDLAFKAFFVLPFIKFIGPTPEDKVSRTKSSCNISHIAFV